MKSNHFAEVGKISEKKEFKPLDVGATERVDWKVAQGLSKYVHFDENGNAVIGKNLEVKGTTKLSGGFNPIHVYNITAGEYPETIFVYFESQSLDGWYQFVGKNGNNDLIFGVYSIDSEILIKCAYLTFADLDANGLTVSVYDSIKNQYNSYQVAYVK